MLFIPDNNALMIRHSHVNKIYIKPYCYDIVLLEYRISFIPYPCLERHSQNELTLFDKNTKTFRNPYL